MTTTIKKNVLFLALATLAFTACKKDKAEPDVAQAIKQNGAISVAASQAILGTGKVSTDSVFAVGAIPKDNRRAVVTAANLLAPTTTYLTTNYPGYTFVKAFSTTAPAAGSAVNGFVVAITFNAKPVAVSFLATGAFKAVLELREGNDLKNNRDHTIGGVFENRNASRRDSVGIAALSTTIRSYMTTNATRDTLRAAWRNRDGSIVLLSKNVTFFSNTFTSAGTFIARNAVASRSGLDVSIASGALPPAILTYLTSTYPNYVFGKAYSTAQNNVINGYVVVIDASLTKYAFVFNSTGVLQSTRVLR